MSNNTPPDLHPTPGPTLKAQRLANEWSVEAVADAMHLSNSAIEALEEDHYEDLPGSTYIIGYWRAYARILRIDIDDLIAASKPHLLDEPRLDVVTPAQEATFVRTRKRGNALSLLTLFGVLSALAFAGWFIYKNDLLNNVVSKNEAPAAGLQPLAEPDATVLTTTEKSTDSGEMPVVDGAIGTEQDIAASLLGGLVPTDAPATVQPVNSIVGTNNNVATISANNSATDGLDVAALVNTEQGGNTDQPVAADSEVQITSAIPFSDSPPNTIAETQVSETTESSAESVRIEAISTGNPNVVSISLSANTWLDVRDNGGKLVFANKLAGELLDIQGTPPFYVFIGDYEAATVRYMNSDVPIAPYQGGPAARLKVGEAQE